MIRSIIILPKFTNVKFIDELRKEYDPLFGKIPPHITLVFPFQSQYSTEDLRNHITKVLHGFQPFELTAKGITGQENGYLFLNIKKGNDQIIELHDRLYSGILSKYLYRKVSYLPHITVGRVDHTDLFEAALQKTVLFEHQFTATVDEIAVEWIDDEENSNIEYIHPFTPECNS